MIIIMIYRMKTEGVVNPETKQKGTSSWFRDTSNKGIVHTRHKKERVEAVSEIVPMNDKESGL